MAARRAAILEAARTMLTEKGVVGEISLRELSHRVGLAKSNVLRYFDSREAVFLEVLDEECQAWLAELDDLLGRPRARKPNYANEIRVATTVADSLVAEPLLCELIGSMAGVLERNISGEFAKDFKARATERTLALSALVARHLPWLPQGFADLFAEGALMPFAHPTIEHFSPLFVALGASGDPEQAPRQIIDGYWMGLAKRSIELV